MTHLQDDFTTRSLPPVSQQAAYPFLDLPQFACPQVFNCSDLILDRHMLEGNGDRIALRWDGGSWTYAQLQTQANRIAEVLSAEPGFKTGSRVLLRSANNAMLIASWFGVLKAGGVAVTTMPLLRARELNTILECAEIAFAICDSRLGEEMEAVSWSGLQKIWYYDGSFQSSQSLEKAMEKTTGHFSNRQFPAETVAIIGFTSGTTGKPKMTAHYHRDILLICKAFPEHCLQLVPEDVVTGSPPIGFTFGLGGLVLFPFFYGASTWLIEKPGPDLLIDSFMEQGVSVCFTAPTTWRILSQKLEGRKLPRLRKCVSAGEALPEKVWQDWKAASGLSLIDGIGATEMLHIFISAPEHDRRPGSLGKAIPGYEACILSEEGEILPPGNQGRLGVRGITGCKYLNREEKQLEYVRWGWNLTGDVFRQDEDGYFYYVSRADSMIISSGYNIAAIEVESVLLTHESVAECAVVGVPDEERGQVICAFIVLSNPQEACDELARAIQNWFKGVAAPYKYPREIRFVSSLPKTETGKTQHFKLKESLV
jgi:2-aminobenzoate-CoA ligase